MSVCTGGAAIKTLKRTLPDPSEALNRACVLLSAVSKPYSISPENGLASEIEGETRISLLVACGTTDADADAKGSASASPARPGRVIRNIVHPPGGRGGQLFPIVHRKPDPVNDSEPSGYRSPPGD